MLSSNATVNTKVVASNSAYKSCPLQSFKQKLSLAIVHTQFFNGNSTYEINDYFIQKILVTIVDQELQQCRQKVIIAIKHNPYAFKCCQFPQFSAIVVNCKMRMHSAYQIYQFY